jgi:hypothetical protein
MRSSPEYVSGPESTRNFQGVPLGFVSRGNVFSHYVSNFWGVPRGFFSLAEMCFLIVPVISKECHMVC